MTSNDMVLRDINTARHLLALAKTVQEANKIVALAEAARVFAKRIQASREATNAAAELRLRAERLMGEMLAQKPPGYRKGPGRGHTKGSTKMEPPFILSIPTVSDLGIDKKLSSRTQALAAVAEREFEAAIEKGRAADLNPNRVAAELRKSQQRAVREAQRKASRHQQEAA